MSGRPGYRASVPAQAGSTYAWSVAGGTITAGATSPIATFTPSDRGFVYLSCVVTDASGASSAPGVFASTIIPPTAAPTVSAPAFVTAGQAGYSASVPMQANFTYAWSITGGTITSGSTTPTVTFTPAGDGTVQLSCVVTSTLGGPNAPGHFSSTIVPFPTSQIRGVPSLMTAGQPGYSASVPMQATSTYAWSISGGVITAGSDTHTVTFTPSDSGTVELSCVVTNAAGTSSASGTFKGDIVPPPATPVVSAPAFVTKGQGGYLATIPPQINSTYAWAITGGTITAGASTPTVTFTPLDGGMFELSCVVTNAAGTSSTPGTFVGSIVPSPTTPIIEAPRYVTAGQPGYHASVPAQGNSTYAWTIEGGAITAGSGTPSVTFTPFRTASFRLSSVVTNAAGTPSTPGTFVGSIVPPPPTPVISSPPFAIAGRSGYIASTPERPGVSYIWNVIGGDLQGGTSGSSVIFGPWNGATLTLSCVAENQAGTRSAPASVEVPVAPPPVTPLRRSATLTANASPLAIGLPDLRSTARMSVSLSNLSTTSVQYPQVFPGSAPLPYTVDDMRKGLPLGAGERELSEAVWRYVRDRFTHYCSGGSPDPDPTDNAVTSFSGINGFGFGCCDQVTRYMVKLWSQLGLPSRHAWMPFHTVGEVYYDGAWHMFDPDHRTYYLRRDGQTVASVEDVLADPELVILGGDANGRDPVGWDSQRMAQLYRENAAGLSYGPPPGDLPALPLTLGAGESFTLFHANQTSKAVRVASFGDPFDVTRVISGQFRSYLPAEQWVLDQATHEVRGVELGWAPAYGPVLRQAGSATGSLDFRRSSPYPLLGARVWVHREGSVGSISARFSVDGTTWSDPVPLVPDRQLAGYTHSADLAPKVRPRRNYFIRVELDSGAQIRSIGLEAAVQANRFNFPLFANSDRTTLWYKDDSPAGQARSMLAAVEAVGLDTQIQGLELSTVTTLANAPPSYVDAPELLASPGVAPTAALDRFEFVFTLDRPQMVRVIRGAILQDSGGPISLAWHVQVRQAEDAPWTDHVAGHQDADDDFEIDTYASAAQVRLVIGASLPFRVRHLAAYGQATSN